MVLIQYMLFFLVQVAIFPALYDALFIKTFFLICLIIPLVYTIIYKRYYKINIFSPAGIALIIILHLWILKIISGGSLLDLITETLVTLWAIRGTNWMIPDKKSPKYLHYFFRMTSVIVLIMGYVLKIKYDTPACVFGNKNFYATYLIFTLPFWLSSPAGYEPNPAKILSLFVSGWIILQLFALRARSALIALFFLIILYFIYQKKRKIQVFILLGVIFMSLSIFPKTRAYLSQIFNRKQETTVDFRIHTWGGVLEGALENMTGIGFGEFSFVYPKYRPAWVIKFEDVHHSETAHAENEYLETLLETGIFGFGLRLWLFITMIKIFNNRRVDDNSLDAFYFSFLGLLIVMFFSVSVRYLPCRFLLYIPLAIIANHNTPHPSKQGFGILPSLVLSVLFITTGLQLVVSELYLNKAILLSHKQLFEQAEPYYKKSLLMNKRHIVAKYFYGNLLCDIKRYDLGISEYNDLKSYAPHYVQIDYRLGNAFFSLENESSAYPHFYKSIKLDPVWSESWAKLGWIHIHREEWLLALRDFKNASNLSPDNQGILNNIGNIYFKIGDLDKALNSYKKLININPENSDACNNIGNIYFQKNEFEEAEVWYQKALNINPKHLSALSNLELTRGKRAK